MKSKDTIYRGECTPDEMDWQVTVDNKHLNPRLDLSNHSPDGFSWGYSGSGPAQCALAILADYFQDDERAQYFYQEFKAAYLAKIDSNRCWLLTGEQLEVVMDNINPLWREK